LETQIYILRGKVRSGKTTKILEWNKNRNNVAGILSPVINGQKHLKLIPSNEIIPLEVKDINDKDILICGKYHFSKKAFEYTNEYIRSLELQSYKWLILDEAGYLELDNSGINDSIKYAIEIIEQRKPDFKIMLVVRDFLVDKISEKYNLRNCKVIGKEELKELG
jgi:nucleoside-triphosphatase THEP1